MRTLLPSRRRDTTGSFSQRAVERIADAVAPAEGRPRRGSFSERAVARITDVVAPATVDRRGFLYRAAITGTAIAVNPFDFAFKPGTAYASVCGQGASCSSGWTAFCCTINNGANMCPPGSYVAGWWRIDDSSFCRGSARYIIDCNRRPGSSCNCRCASGTCDQRRVCCNNFRYGQCNQQIAGVTEVVCRVVTCTAPWRWDPSCTRTVRVDNRTATHSAPCLPGTNPSHIDIKYQDLGMTGAAVGTPTSAERAGANGGRIRDHSNGYIAYLPAVGAWSVRGREATVYRQLGLEGGRLGYPRRDRQTFNWGPGWYARFQRGWITYTAATGAHPVVRPYWQPWIDNGGAKGRRLGLPLADVQAADGGGGYVQRFQRGALLRIAGSSDVIAVFGGYWNSYQRTGGTSGPLGFPVRARRTSLSGRGAMQRFDNGMLINSSRTGIRAVLGTTQRRYQQLGYDSSSLGFPTERQIAVGDGRGTVQGFEGGAIYATTATGAWEVLTRFRGHYLEVGSCRGPLGYPRSAEGRVSDGIGWFQVFEDGRMFQKPRSSPRAVWGAIDRRYRAEGGPAGSRLGYPVSDVVERNGTTEECRFEHGRITHHTLTGQVEVTYT
jgi:uncharacterized protein with LGFP repeats